MPAGTCQPQDAVELTVLSLYTKPGRRVDLRQPRRALLSAAARRWVLDAFRPDAEDSRRRRTRARLRAVEELSDAELLQLVEVIDVVDVIEVGTNGAIDRARTSDVRARDPRVAGRASSPPAAVAPVLNPVVSSDGDALCFASARELVGRHPRHGRSRPAR